MSTGPAETRDEAKRRDDEQAREEIRELFARYRRLARHGMVRERHEPRPPQPAHASTPPTKGAASSGRAGASDQ